MKFAIRNHPAQLSIAGVPQYDDDGIPVPLFPDQKALTLDGRMIAYISKHGVSFTICLNRLGPVVHKAALEYVRENYGMVPKVSAVPDDRKIEEYDDDDESDD